MPPEGVWRWAGKLSWGGVRAGVSGRGPAAWPVSSDSVSDQRSLCSRLEVTKRPFPGILFNSTGHGLFPGVAAFSMSCLSERKRNDKTSTGLRTLGVQPVLDHAVKLESWKAVRPSGTPVRFSPVPCVFGEALKPVTHLLANRRAN